MIIYKYLDPKGAKKTIDGKSVLLREPEKFNDPFDCKFYSDSEEYAEAFDLYLNFKIFELFYNSLVKQQSKNNIRTNMMKCHLERIAKGIKKTKAYFSQESMNVYLVIGMKKLGKDKNAFKKEFDGMIKGVYEKLRKIVLVSCFGSNFDSILMWSHYADKHKGACIEYEIDDKDFKPVNYSENLPVFQITRLLGIVLGHMFLGEDPDMEKEEYQFALEPLLTKSNDWKYEGEVRCVYPNNKPNAKIHPGLDDDGNEIKLLDMPQIKKIYIGCKADKDFELEIKNLAGGIPVVRMKMAESEYKVFPEEV